MKSKATATALISVLILLVSACEDRASDRASMSGDAATATTQLAVPTLEPTDPVDVEKIAFVSDRENEDGFFHLFVMEADGSNVRRLTSGESNNLEPSWSPTGTEILFVSDRNGNFDIFVVALDGSFLDVAYARNFYDTDQRPLRGILERFEPPMLVIHGERDVLVPAAAAREHHRLVPHSELAMLPARSEEHTSEL